MYLCYEFFNSYSYYFQTSTNTTTTTTPSPTATTATTTPPTDIPPSTLTDFLYYMIWPKKKWMNNNNNNNNENSMEGSGFPFATIALILVAVAVMWIYKEMKTAQRDYEGLTVLEDHIEEYLKVHPERRKDFPSLTKRDPYRK